jgi:transposase
MPTRQLAEKIGVSPNWGYVLAQQLRDQGLIRKQDKGYRATKAE